MNMRKRQQGITLLWMIIGISIAGVFAYCGMKVVPMYQEFWAVQQAMEEVAATPNIKTVGTGKIIDLLERRFNISYVDSVQKEHIFIDMKKGPTLTITYEVRKPLMYNLDIVGRFTHTVTLTGS
jgi:Tfp pilus assembly major pilin PilA